MKRKKKYTITGNDKWAIKLLWFNKQNKDSLFQKQKIAFHDEGTNYLSGNERTTYKDTRKKKSLNVLSPLWWPNLDPNGPT